MKTAVERTELSTYNVSPNALRAFLRSASVRPTIAETLRAAVGIGALVAREEDDKCFIYGGEHPLPIGEPRQLVYWPDAEGKIECQTFQGTRLQLAQLAAKFGIDENSALNWCIDCLDRFDEAYDDRLTLRSVSKYANPYGGFSKLKLQGRSRRRRRWNV